MVQDIDMKYALHLSIEWFSSVSGGQIS